MATTCRNGGQEWVTGCGRLSQSAHTVHTRLHRSTANLGVGLGVENAVAKIIVYLQCHMTIIGGGKAAGAETFGAIVRAPWLL